MTFEKFKKDYGHYVEKFNSKEFNERVELSGFMTYEAILELIRSKKNLQNAMDNIDKRINELKKNLKSKTN